MKKSIKKWVSKIKSPNNIITQKDEQSSSLSETNSPSQKTTISTQSSSERDELSQDYNEFDSGLSRSPNTTSNTPDLLQTPIPENPSQKEAKVEKTDNHVNPMFLLLSPKSNTRSPISLQLTQTTQVQKVRNISVSQRQVDAFFEIFQDSYVQDFLRCDSCFLLSDKFLNAAVISILVRSRIDPDHYRSMYFIVLYLVNEILEESHHKYHILQWVRDDPATPGFVFENVDTTTVEKVVRRIVKIRFDFIKDLLNYRVLTSMTTLQAYMRVLPSHFIWQRERCESHRGKQLTVTQLQTTNRNEAEWILFYGGKNWHKYECTIDGCTTRDSYFTRGFKPFLNSRINGKRKSDEAEENYKEESDNFLIVGNNQVENEEEQEISDNEATRCKNARLELSCMLRIQESQAKVMQWLAAHADQSLDNPKFYSNSQFGNTYEC